MIFIVTFDIQFALIDYQERGGKNEKKWRKEKKERTKIGVEIAGIYSKNANLVNISIEMESRFDSQRLLRRVRPSISRKDPSKCMMDVSLELMSWRSIKARRLTKRPRRYHRKKMIQDWRTITIELTRCLGGNLGRLTNGRASNDIESGVCSTFRSNCYWNTRLRSIFRVNMIPIFFVLIVFHLSVIFLPSSILPFSLLPSFLLPSYFLKQVQMKTKVDGERQRQLRNWTDATLQLQ